MSILEPACGNGAIVKVLKEKGFAKIICYDKETNFLKETKQYPYIITNPPYSLAYEFIQKAKEIAYSEFAMLLPLSYLHGKKDMIIYGWIEAIHYQRFISLLATLC